MVKHEGWTNKEWNLVIRSLNEELPPEECGVKLNKEEQASYMKDLEWLKKERAENPKMPISFSLVEKEYE